ncbi:MAG: carbon-nitrogen hydrolase family protein [Planctomycetes bacterium]|nr:carbon-nitrogen hydrolase family protein [Planctomycetota bacterium]
MIRKFAVALFVAGILFSLSQTVAGGEKGVNMLENGNFEPWRDGRPLGWQWLADRDEIRPPLAMKKKKSGGHWASLSALPSGLSMGWLTQRVDTSAMAGQWVRFSCLVRVTGSQDPRFNARISLDWERGPKKKGWMPTWEFARITKRIAADTYLAEHVTQVPAWSVGLKVLLGQYGGKSGSVAFGEVRLTPTTAPRPRRVKIAAAYRPPVRGGWARTLTDVERLTEEAAGQGCDLILFGEGLTVVGTGKSYVDVAQPIPGPATDALAGVARRHKIYLAAGVYEREGQAVYNTAVLLDRQGRLVGKYRKVHLPYSELKGGLQPGNDYPVFDTELGRIGMQVCYDHFFPEVARCLALNGAEIILTPIWGDVRGDRTQYEAVARARAIDNAVVYVTSIYAPLGSLIVDQFGRVLARTYKGVTHPGLAVAEVDLDLPHRPDQEFSKRQAFPMNFRAERRPQSYGPIVRQTLPDSGPGRGD